MVSEYNAFRIRQNLVPFCLVDVCFGLELLVVEEEVILEDNGGGLVNDLFDNGEEIKLHTILNKLGDKKFRKKKNVDDFWRLYILVALCVFYLPRTSRTFPSFPFKLLDNLNALHVYNWGVQFIIY